MITQGLLALAMALGTAAQTPPQQTPPEFDRGAPDSLKVHETQAKQDEARRYFADFSRCIAGNSKRQAAALLAMTYGSAEQSKGSSKIVGPNDSCWGPMISSMSVGYSGSALVGGMAEYFILHPKEIDALRGRYPASFVWPGPNAMEAFGSCVVDQGEAPVRALISTRVTSDAEAAAMEALGNQLGQCVSEGQTMDVSIGSLRQLLAVALYRRMATPTTVPPAAPAATPAAAPAKP